MNISYPMFLSSLGCFACLCHSRSPANDGWGAKSGAFWFHPAAKPCLTGLRAMIP